MSLVSRMAAPNPRPPASATPSRVATLHKGQLVAGWSIQSAPAYSGSTYSYSLPQLTNLKCYLLVGAHNTEIRENTTASDKIWQVGLLYK